MLRLVAPVLPLLASSMLGQGPAPRELGAVAFARDLDAVLESGPPKPLFLLFQEIPG